MATQKSRSKSPARVKDAALTAEPRRVKIAAAEQMQDLKDAKNGALVKKKLVRDSFTIPKSEYVALTEIKQRAIRAGRPAKKSEILRAGIMALTLMSDAELLAALGMVPSLKTGRPQKADKAADKLRAKKK